MRRRILAVLLTVVTSTVTLVVTDAPAVAYPIDDVQLPVRAEPGPDLGHLTWYNRSVGVQGSVTDVGYAGNTFVAFTFSTSAPSSGTATRPARRRLPTGAPRLRSPSTGPNPVRPVGSRGWTSSCATRVMTASSSGRRPDPRPRGPRFNLDGSGRCRVDVIGVPSFRGEQVGSNGVEECGGDASAGALAAVRAEERLQSGCAALPVLDQRASYRQRLSRALLLDPPRAPGALVPWRTDGQGVAAEPARLRPLARSRRYRLVRSRATLGRRQLLVAHVGLCHDVDHRDVFVGDVHTSCVVVAMNVAASGTAKVMVAGDGLTPLCIKRCGHGSTGPCRGSRSG